MLNEMKAFAQTCKPKDRENQKNPAEQLHDELVQMLDKKSDTYDETKDKVDEDLKKIKEEDP